MKHLLIPILLSFCISCNNYRKFLPFVEFVDLKENKSSIEINTKSIKDLSIYVQDSTGNGIYIQFRDGQPSIFSQEKNRQTNGYVVTFQNGKLNGISQYYSGKFPNEYPKECQNDSMPFRASVIYGKYIYFINDSLYQEDFGWGEELENYNCIERDSLK